MVRVLHFRNLIDKSVADQYLAIMTASSTSGKATIADEKTRFRSTVECILDSNLPAHEKQLQRVVNEVWLCINAGIDTTGQAMTCAAYMVLSHPEVLKRLREEIGQCEVRLGRLPSSHELRELSYLNAVVQEAFRLNHPIAGRLPRTDPDNEILYKDKVIPKNVTVSTSTFDVYLDSNIFRDPHKFLPERWLDEGERKRLRKYVNNFGRGARNCVGMEVANMTIFLTLGRLFSPSLDFELSLHDTSFERDVVFYTDFFGTFPTKDSNHVQVTVR
ncbi:hypothetical protein ACJQWK_04541 [Exserohilum turcicum]